MIVDVLQDSSRKWYRQPPASSKAIADLIDCSGLDLPHDYQTFLASSNGGEGDLSVEPGWFNFWPVEEALQLNRDYEVQKWLPEFFGFGSNGGGELLAFKITAPNLWVIYMIPFGSLTQEDAVLIAKNFADFMEAIGRKFDE